MSVSGTSRKCRRGSRMSAIGAIPDDICSARVFRILTHCGPLRPKHGREVRIGLVHLGRNLCILATRA